MEVLVNEIKRELKLNLSNEELEIYVNQGKYEINEIAGTKIDFDKDLKSRGLLKNYVTYAVYKRLAEFKSLYMGELADVQIRYNRDTEL